jgi:hypothetical protein
VGGEISTLGVPKKNLLQLIQRIFVEKYATKSPDLEENNSEIVIFGQWVGTACQQKYTVNPFYNQALGDHFSFVTLMNYDLNVYSHIPY